MLSLKYSKSTYIQIIQCSDQFAIFLIQKLDPLERFHIMFAFFFLYIFCPCFRRYNLLGFILHDMEMVPMFYSFMYGLFLIHTLEHGWTNQLRIF